MVAAELKEKAMDYFSLLDDEKAQQVILYMESFDIPEQQKKKSLADLKGKIQFSEGYDYKAMRSAQ